ncbi:FAD-dependent monooxygenase [Streptomyces blattellae]|uniref:FAD-dependent monooxygenase n=1 Tax=Streptomyces blattellae TaxID=2569855 RepID=UPI0012B9B207|nr:FAD-dependent monooxygenase [Streptomyces blattellae]
MIRPTSPGPTGAIDCSASEVVVVGGGPVGLAMTLELGRRGVDVLMVDAGDGVVSYPTAESIDVRTMEWLRSAGCGDAVDDSGFPVDYARDISFTATLAGPELVRFARPSNAERRATTGGLSAEGAAWWPKFWFDSALRERAEALSSVTLRYQWRCADFAQDASGVTLTLVRDEEVRQVRAQFVVACDGGQSTLRRACGIGMSGSAREARWQGAMVEIPGLLDALPLDPAVQYYLLAPRRLILGSLDGGDFWRVTYPLRDGETSGESQAMSAVRDALGGLDLPVVLHGARGWSGNSVVAERFRDGRVFLAGDAAHQMWPSGGHGMNTGIGDVQNLGWKLEAALRGRAGPALLDSYELERRPVAERNVRRAASNYAADIALPSGPELLGEDAAAQALRRTAAELVRDTRATEWASLGIQLGFRYSGSAILPGTATPEPADDPGDYVPVVRVGHRAPHVQLADGRALIDALGTGFTVLRARADASAEEWTRAFKLRGYDLEIVDVPATEEYATMTVCLVRPDGVVCWEEHCTTTGPGDVASIVLGHEAA